MRNQNISVCMATYNGEKYLREQINSILLQLQEADELIIVDDNSTDSTRAILKSYSDDRINLIFNEHNIGVNKNFEKAIINAKNRYIFLADQDDIWTEGRVNIMFKEFQNLKTFVVSGNFLNIDEHGLPLSSPYKRLNSRDSNKKTSNIFNIFIGNAAYFGCAMAFSREILDIILPFPDYIESHDLWIAMAGILLNGNVHCDSNVLYRRIHCNNVSLVSRKVTSVVFSRIIFIRHLVEILKRKKRLWSI